MEKAYTRTNWTEDTAPFIDAENLNNIENGIDTIDDRVVELSDKTDAMSDTLEELTKDFSSMGQEVNLTNNVSFTCPEDGYLYLFCNKNAGQSGYGYVNGKTVLYISTPAEHNLASYIGASVFVKKGAVIRYGTNSSGCKAQYHPYA